MAKNSSSDGFLNPVKGKVGLRVIICSIVELITRPQTETYLHRSNVTLESELVCQMQAPVGRIRDKMKSSVAQNEKNRLLFII